MPQMYQSNALKNPMRPCFQKKIISHYLEDLSFLMLLESIKNLHSLQVRTGTF